jgi:sugar/nucleoside kinase (ribokinase family)
VPGSRARASDARWAAVTAGAVGLVERVGATGFYERARGANVVFANAAEARVLTGLEGSEAAVALACDYELVIVTAGTDEATLATRGGRVEHARPLEVAPEPVVGAGDALAGAFLAALVAGADLGEALASACAAAAAAAGASRH